VPRERNYAAEYARRVALARERGLPAAAARGRRNPTAPPEPAATRYIRGKATASGRGNDVARLQRWSKTRAVKDKWGVLGGRSGLSPDTLLVLGSLDLSPRSLREVTIGPHGRHGLEPLSVTRHEPGDGDLWRVTFWPVRGNPRVRDMAADTALIAELRWAMGELPQDVELTVDTDGARQSTEPLVDDDEAEAAWEASSAPTAEEMAAELRAAEFDLPEGKRPRRRPAKKAAKKKPAKKSTTSTRKRTAPNPLQRALDAATAALAAQEQRIADLEAMVAQLMKPAPKKRRRSK
jgi:hypothetical protein